MENRSDAERSSVVRFSYFVLFVFSFSFSRLIYIICPNYFLLDDIRLHRIFFISYSFVFFVSVGLYMFKLVALNRF